MAERLTKEYYYTWDENGTKKLNYIQKLQNKLGKLEDILEKYGIESVEELECFLDDYSKNQGRYFAICEEMDDLKKDRDTWKRACELACIKLMPYRINMVGGLFTNDELKEKMDCFYQQAKNEGDTK